MSEKARITDFEIKNLSEGEIQVLNKTTAIKYRFVRALVLDLVLDAILFIFMIIVLKRSAINWSIGACIVNVVGAVIVFKYNIDKNKLRIDKLIRGVEIDGIYICGKEVVISYFKLLHYTQRSHTEKKCKLYAGKLKDISIVQKVGIEKPILNISASRLEIPYTRKYCSYLNSGIAEQAYMGKVSIIHSQNLIRKDRESSVKLRSKLKKLVTLLLFVEIVYLITVNGIDLSRVFGADKILAILGITFAEMISLSVLFMLRSDEKKLALEKMLENKEVVGFSSIPYSKRMARLHIKGSDNIIEFIDTSLEILNSSKSKRKDITIDFNKMYIICM